MFGCFRIQLQKLTAPLIGHPLFGLLLYGPSLKEPGGFMLCTVQGSCQVVVVVCVCVCCLRIKPGVECSFLHLMARSCYCSCFRQAPPVIPKVHKRMFVKHNIVWTVLYVNIVRIVCCELEDGRWCMPYVDCIFYR